MASRRWAVFYDDGTMFTSEDGAWEDAPSDGVLYVLAQQGDIIQTVSGSDHYILLDDNTIATTDDLGPLLRKWGVKFGRWTSHRQMEEVGKHVAIEAAKWPR